MNKQLIKLISRMNKADETAVKSLRALNKADNKLRQTIKRS